MARLDYARKRRMLIYAVALLIGVCCIVLSACNKDAGVYDVSDKGATLEVNHFIAKFINILYEGIGNIGWTVVAFTVILKLILSPLDIWQKMITRKNAKAMERMKPQLEILQAKYGDDKQKFQQEQMALYKREKYSTFGACLPTIVTLVVFFVIFAGFREMVGWKYANDYQDCYNVYDQAMTAELGEDWENEANAELFAAAKDKAQTAVYEFYYDDAQVESRSFLWIKNIFVPDGWQKAVPDYLTVTGQQGMVTSRITGVQADEYEAVMGKVLGTGGWAKEGKWNGFLILPILSLALSVISQKLMSAAQGTGEKKEKKTFKQRIEKLKNLGAPAPAQAQQANGKEKKPDQAQASMKMMQYMMPVITAVFALMYSSAFALYMLVSSLTSTVFQLAFNLVFKIIDKKKAQNPVAKKAR